MAPPIRVPANEAEPLIRSREAPPGLTVTTPLTMRDVDWLPEDLSVQVATISGSLSALPDGFSARRAVFHTPALARIGQGVRCGALTIEDAALRRAPSDLQVRDRLDLSRCRELTELPEGLRTGALNLSECVALERLPENLTVSFLDLAGCASLKALPESLRMDGGRLNLRDCVWFRSLPANLGTVAQLDLAGCLNLTELPEGLDITSWVDIAGTSIERLPPRFDQVGLRWRGVAVSRRMIFEPDTFSAEEILAEQNAEIRRVMMERYGYDRLFEEAKAEVLDEDVDAGGERRLLRMPVPGDEDLVCVAVRCPSTGHRFVLRVPPSMRSCRQAIAWTAGFDNPEYYQPEIET